MKSKKENLEIINKFIDICLENNISSPDQILNEAKNQIKEIDSEMAKILKLKNKKIELLEIVNYFSEFNNKNNKFTLIKDHAEAMKICKEVANNKNIINLFSKNIFKQLVEYKILEINNKNIILGKEYYNYESFLK